MSMQKHLYRMQIYTAQPAVLIIVRFPVIRRPRTTPVLNYGKNTGKYSDLLLAEKNNIFSIRTAFPNFFSDCNCAYCSKIRQRPCSGFSPDSFYADVQRAFLHEAHFVHLYSDNIQFLPLYHKISQLSRVGFIRSSCHTVFS